jgi:hypothetical protein
MNCIAAGVAAVFDSGAPETIPTGALAAWDGRLRLRSHAGRISATLLSRQLEQVGSTA